MTKILVTGANGLVGKILCQKLSEHYNQVYGITQKTLTEKITKINYIQLDFSCSWNAALLPKSMDVIIHLAQSSKFRDFPENVNDVFNVNVESTLKLLNYCKNAGVKKFIYASSGGVYGGGKTAFMETSQILPAEKLGFYLGSKIYGEILVQSYATLMQIIVLRPFFIYGPGQNRNMLIPRLINNINTNNPINIAGENGILINPIHVEDASASIVKAINLKNSGIFNIAGPKVLSLRDICEGIGTYLGKKPLYIHQSEQAEDLIGDITLMCNKLIYPERNLLESLSTL